MNLHGIDYMIFLPMSWFFSAGQPNRCKVIIPNPQIPPNQYGYLRFVESGNIVVPSFFNVTETTDKRIASDLKLYFRLEKSDRPMLNFRSSIVRQLILAFALGYKEISIFGLDPSTPTYWWSSDDSSNEYSPTRFTPEFHRFRDSLEQITFVMSITPIVLMSLSLSL